MKRLVHVQGRQDVQFVLVGGGPQLDSLKRYCRGMALDDYVTFTGRVPDDMLFTVLATADVCVNPDRVNAMNDKSTMNKILEYMAAGRPIAAASLPAVREVLEHERTALLYKPASTYSGTTATYAEQRGVRCTVVRDTVSSRGRPIERTLDAVKRNARLWTRRKSITSAGPARKPPQTRPAQPVRRTS